MSAYDWGILDADGNVHAVPYEVYRKWAEAQVWEARCVAQTEIEPGVTVSTVFLTLDHGFGGVPLWFETMVFGGPMDEETERYETKAQAIAGHAVMVESVKESLARIELVPSPLSTPSASQTAENQIQDSESSSKETGKGGNPEDSNAKEDL